MGSSEAELILRSVVSSIHRSPSLLSICTAGGCANALSWLLSLEPGATSTVLEAVAPHAREAMEAYLDAPVQVLQPPPPTPHLLLYALYALRHPTVN